MASRPLIVAGVASALLVVLLVADASMNLVVHLDVREDGGWRRVASDPFAYDDARMEPTPYGPGAKAVPANQTVEMRLRVDNGNAWGYAETYRAYVNGVEVASGDLAAPARGEGEAVFSFDSGLAMDQAGYRSGPTSPETWPLGVLVIVGDARLEAYFEVREASA